MLREIFKNSCIPVVLIVIGLGGLLGLLEAYIQKHPAPTSGTAQVRTTSWKADEVTQTSRWIPSIAGQPAGWVWIVTSRPTELEARVIAEHYADKLKGVSIKVLKSQAQDTIRYRVAIGHYESREIALAERNRWNGELPPDAWILNLNSDL